MGESAEVIRDLATLARGLSRAGRPWFEAQPAFTRVLERAPAELSLAAVAYFDNMAAVRAAGVRLDGSRKAAALSVDADQRSIVFPRYEAARAIFNNVTKTAANLGPAAISQKGNSPDVVEATLRLLAWRAWQSPELRRAYMQRRAVATDEQTQFTVRITGLVGPNRQRRDFGILRMSRRHRVKARHIEQLQQVLDRLDCDIDLAKPPLASRVFASGYAPDMDDAARDAIANYTYATLSGLRQGLRPDRLLAHTRPFFNRLPAEAVQQALEYFVLRQRLIDTGGQWSRHSWHAAHARIERGLPAPNQALHRRFLGAVQQVRGAFVRAARREATSFAPGPSASSWDGDLSDLTVRMVVRQAGGRFSLADQFLNRVQGIDPVEAADVLDRESSNSALAAAHLRMLERSGQLREQAPAHWRVSPYATEVSVTRRDRLAVSEFITVIVERARSATSRGEAAVFPIADDVSLDTRLAALHAVHAEAEGIATSRQRGTVSAFVRAAQDAGLTRREASVAARLASRLIADDALADDSIVETYLGGTSRIDRFRSMMGESLLDMPEVPDLADYLFRRHESDASAEMLAPG